MPIFRLFLLIVVGGSPFFLSAQDVENTADNIKNIGQKGLKISGGFQFDNRFYGASGIDARRDNYQWGVNANLTFSLAGLSAPFSFTFSDANRNFRLPSYTFAGISPKFRWATLHAGDRSLSFSPYTMSGISFRGIGLELNPGKFQFATFYGRLNRALASDLDALGDLNGLYNRNGYGARFGYANKGFSYTANYFGANDDEGDLTPETLTNGQQPVRNNVFSLEGRQRFGKKISANGEFAFSEFNRNKLLADEGVEGQAYKLGADYNAKEYSLSVGYERLTRGFRTLGALFFNNDIENITAGINYRMLKGKLNLGLRAGIERSNLDNQELETTDRFILSTNLNYRPDAKWNYSANYSNFRNDTKLRVMTDINLPIDSIFLAQVTQSAGTVISRRLGKDKAPKTLSLITNLQRANNIINDTIDANSVSRFMMTTLVFAGGTPSGWRYNAGLSYNRTELVSFNSTLFTPTASISRSFLNNQLNVGARSSLSWAVQNGEDNSQILNLGLNASYKLQNAHRITLNTSMLNRAGSDQENKNFTEFFGQLSYGFNFGTALRFSRGVGSTR